MSGWPITTVVALCLVLECLSVSDPQGYVVSSGDCPQFGDISLLRRDSLDNCARKCNLDSKCAAFTFNRPTRDCFFKNKVCNSGYSTRDPGNKFYAKVSYVTEKIPGYVAMIGDCPGNDINSIRSTNPVLCANECNKRPDCVTFMHYDRAVCFLKKALCDILDQSNRLNTIYIKPNVKDLQQYRFEATGVCSARRKHKRSDRTLTGIGDDMNSLRQRAMEEFDRDVLRRTRSQFALARFGEQTVGANYHPRTHGAHSSPLHVERYILNNCSTTLANAGSRLDVVFRQCPRRLVLYTEQSPCRDCLRALVNWARNHQDIMVEVGFRFYYYRHYYRTPPGGRDGQRLAFEETFRSYDPPHNIVLIPYDVDESNNLWHDDPPIRRSGGGSSSSGCRGSGCNDELKK